MVPGQTENCNVIRAGDLITEVNGLYGDPARMVAECQAFNLLKLKLIRPPGPPEDEDLGKKNVPNENVCTRSIPRVQILTFVSADVHFVFPNQRSFRTAPEVPVA